MERLNTALPCQHELVLAVKLNLPLLLGDRWHRDYEGKADEGQVLRIMKHHKMENMVICHQLKQMNVPAF